MREKYLITDPTEYEAVLFLVHRSWCREYHRTDCACAVPFMTQMVYRLKQSERRVILGS